ncbi:major facilitator superfamily domain-containing protein [Colletotrichum acutatum]|uniref:Major facilitator superfamily domain-containing protein n=1 Tax=Glomerella acutata TaxID=27357 RepID=A0AAD8X7S9_GLOAC|nr:major facilitator superfamily domain-containing protein [Colletotrichum acutatum]KAK1705311.1 major facilitator superfamily domain-containing protein [Colletotrichum acutatum]
MAEEEFIAHEKSLVKKLDYTLVPMVWLLYLFNYLDRNNIAQARLSSFEKDLNLTGNQFNVAVSILNIGYMLMQLPSNMLITRTRPGTYIPACTALWSIVSAATAGAGNYTHLLVIRFFLGIAEAPFFPGAMFLLSCWYPCKELALRTAVLYSGVLLATAFSGLIAAGVLSGLEGARGIASWQWLFIIEGAGSFTAALLGFVLLPDFPGQKSGVAKWLLTDAEQRVAVERIRRDRVSLPEADSSVWNGLKLAIKDPLTWVFVVMLTANHSAYGFNNFFPTIVKGFKLGSNTLTLILTAPPYLLATVVAFTTAWSSDRLKERGFHISVPQGVACVGFIISVSTVNIVARYFAAFLYICGCFSSNAMVFSWASSTLNQTPEKRACATAIINLLSQLGNVWSPYFFPSNDGPRYVMANLLMMASSALSIVTCVIMKIMLTRANKSLKGESRDTTLFTL